MNLTRIFGLSVLGISLIGSAQAQAPFYSEMRPRVLPQLRIRSYNPATAQYKDTKSFMAQLANQYPQTTKLITVGPSDSGDVIQGLQIGNGPVAHLLVATHHGNEYGSTEVAKAFALSVAQNPLPGITMYVIPVLNISGYNAKNREEVAHGTSYDPNRNYPGACGTEGPFTLKDTAALAQFVADKNIVASGTLHTYSPAVCYPWGMSTHDLSTGPDNDAVFKNLVQAAVVESHYPAGNSTQLIYGANGTYEDFAFWKFGIWSILFELGNTHSPSNSQIKQMIAVNVPGIRRMFAQAPTRRADRHDFAGKCDMRLFGLDRHDE